MFSATGDVGGEDAKIIPHAPDLSGRACDSRGISFVAEHSAVHDPRGVGLSHTHREILRLRVGWFFVKNLAPHFRANLTADGVSLPPFHRQRPGGFQRREVEPGVILTPGIQRAPFYQDWRIELAAIAPDGTVLETWPVKWTLRGLQPSETTTRWETLLERTASHERACTLALRVVNPMPGGKRLRFANAAENRDAKGWLSLGPLP